MARGTGPGRAGSRTVQGSDQGVFTTAHYHDHARRGVGAQGHRFAGAARGLATLAQERSPLVVQQGPEIREGHLHVARCWRSKARLRRKGDRGEGGLPQFDLRRHGRRAVSVFGERCGNAAPVDGDATEACSRSEMSVPAYLRWRKMGTIPDRNRC